MRKLLTMVMLALTFSAWAALPAAAQYEARDTRDWTDGPRFHRPAAVQPTGRLARATHGEDYYYGSARPRRHTYGANTRTAKRHHATRRHLARAGKKAHRHVAQRSTRHHRHAAVHRERQPTRSSKLASAPPAPAPTWKDKSLSTTGPRGSGQIGVASFYWEGQRVASGGWFNPNALTAAHKSLPFGTRVRVTHLGNGRSVEVMINDRGPFIAGRIIDLSKAAAGIIGMTGQGIARVAVEVLGR